MEYRYILLAPANENKNWKGWSITLTTEKGSDRPKLALIHNRSGREIPINNRTSLVAEIISKASGFEWESHIQEQLGGKFSDLIKKDGRAKEVLEFILNKGPQNILVSKNIDNMFINCTNLDAHDKAIDKEIIDRAKKASKIKNILLVPEYVTNSEIDADDIFLTDIAKSLFFKVKEAGNNIDIGIIGITNSSTKETPKDSFFKRLMNKLSSETSQISRSEFYDIHKKSGPLLIEGATGTGKSQAAKLIADKLEKNIFSVNLASVSEGELFESRMRGFEKGIFTGAEKEKEGWFELAKDGVLFLDEFQSVGLPLQTQLLDLLNAISDEVTIGRVGNELKPNTYFVKVILAVNEPIKDLLKKGKLREDLFHRIREVITFDSINDLMRKSENEFNFFQYFWIYRWKSFDKLTIDDINNIEHLKMAQLFPKVENEIKDLICSSDWPGSFRQLERFIYDIFWEISRLDETYISLDMIQKKLLNERIRIFKDQDEKNQFEKISPNDHLDEIVAFVEDTIKSNNFKIMKSLEHIKKNGKYHGISSRLPLYKFLTDNRERFSKDFFADSKLKNILSKHK